jgi:hypothetical protein
MLLPANSISLARNKYGNQKTLCLVQSDVDTTRHLLFEPFGHWARDYAEQIGGNYYMH